MKDNVSIYFLVFLFFIIYFSQMAFAQNITQFSNTSKSFNLGGLYTSTNNDKYFLKQIGNSIWWIGTDKNGSLIKNIFKGNVIGNIIKGEWINLPLNLTTTSGGSANFAVSLDSGNISINKLSSNGSFAISQLNKVTANATNPTQFMIYMDNINVIIPRAPLYDVLFVGLGAEKDNSEPIISTAFLGNSESNSNYSLSLGVGPFKLDPNNKGVTIEFIGLNKENAEVVSTLINIKEIMTQLFDPSFNSYTLSDPYQGDIAVRSVSPDLHLYACNGLVFADKIFIPTEELIKSFNNSTEYSQEKIYKGVGSTGCGPNSEYQIKWSVVPLK